jgi:hypothetical protein|tara:strand:+ start:17306 stop:17527 length:222 start_codon:yes stop_codon:yes gene_type:complete
MAREFLRRATPAEVEQLKERKQAYCKEMPDDPSCEEEVNTDAMVEVGQMAMVMSGLASSICLVLVVMMLMRKK